MKSRVMQTVHKSAPPSKEKKASEHPTYVVMVQAAIRALQDKKGASRQAIHKYILANYSVGDNMSMVNAHLRKSLKSTVEKGLLKLTSGTGAAGRFKLATAPVTSKKAEPKAPAASKKAEPKAPTASKKAEPKAPAASKKAAMPKKAPVMIKKTVAKKTAPLKVTKKPATEVKMPKIKKTIEKKPAKKTVGVKTAQKAVAMTKAKSAEPETPQKNADANAHVTRMRTRSKA